MKLTPRERLWGRLPVRRGGPPFQRGIRKAVVGEYSISQGGRAMRAKSKPSSVLLTALFCGASICAADDASAGNYSVPGTSNPYLSGMPSGSACCFGDSAPAESPVYAGPATAGETFTFTNVTGTVTNARGSEPREPPDGERPVAYEVHRMMADRPRSTTSPATIGCQLTRLSACFLVRAFQRAILRQAC